MRMQQQKGHLKGTYTLQSHLRAQTSTASRQREILKNGWLSKDNKRMSRLVVIFFRFWLLLNMIPAGEKNMNAIHNISWAHSLLWLQSNSCISFFFLCRVGDFCRQSWQQPPCLENWPRREETDQMEKSRLNCVRAWRPTVSKRTPDFYKYTYKPYEAA